MIKPLIPWEYNSVINKPISPRSPQHNDTVSAHWQGDVRSREVILDPLLKGLELLALKILCPPSDLALPEELVRHLLRAAVLPQISRRLPHVVDRRALAERIHILLAQGFAEELPNGSKGLPFMTSPPKEGGGVNNASKIAAKASKCI